MLSRLPDSLRECRRYTAAMLLALLASIVPLTTLAASSANFVIPANVVNNAGVSTASANFKMDASLGGGIATPVGISANFNLKAGFQPMAHTGSISITSANNTSLTVNVFGSFTVIATGTPTAPTLALTGTLPSGVSFTPATGVIAGTPVPGTVGTYNVTITASNGIATNATQSFTLTVTPSGQIITFVTPANVRLSSPMVTLSAFASSGLPVSFASFTPAVCLVSGNVVTAVSAGICTIQAMQSGNGSFAAAAVVVQSFTVLPGVPNAPILIACTASSRTASCVFTAPVPSGDFAPTGYTLNCQTGANPPLQTSGTVSPLVITTLSNGLTYQCSATANNANGSSVSSNTIPVTPFSTLATDGSTDINGDGKAELVLRGANNTLMGTLNANNQFDFTPILGPGPAWRILGVGDFRGTHRSDLLVQNIASGNVHIWLNFDGPPDGDVFVRNVKKNWVVEAIADLDGDGKSDIVWRFINPEPGDDDSGVVFVWFMNGTTISQVKHRGGAPTTWSLIGTTDLNNDGMADLIWQSPTGVVRSLIGNPGRNFVNSMLGTVPAGYNVIKVYDFDGDGNGDLLFRNAAGKMKLWRMSGTTRLAEVNLPDTDPTWVFFAAADVNGDNTGDIVWKKPDGTLVLWLMNAVAPASPTIVDPAGTAPSGYNVVE